MKKIKRKIYKQRITYVMAQTLEKHGFATKEPTEENTIEAYYQGGNKSLWVPPIDMNAIFELGQRWELYRNYRANCSRLISKLVEDNEMDPKERKRRISFMINRMRMFEERFVDMFRLAHYSHVSRDPIIRGQLEAMKTVGIALTRQGIKIRLGRRRRELRARKKELGQTERVRRVKLGKRPGGTRKKY